MKIFSNKRILAIIIIAILVIGFFAVQGVYKMSVGGEVAPEIIATTTQVTLPGGVNVSVSGPGGVTVAPVLDSKVSVKIPAPDFSIPLVFSDSVSPESKQIMQNKLVELQKTLLEKPTDFLSLIGVGSLRKMAGDYAGTETVWVYVSKIYPKEGVIFSNLGNLYMDFVKDYPKSEKSYLMAIQLRPSDVGAYSALYSLYTDYGFKKDTNSAEQILKKGVDANPKAVDLHVLLARYYVAHNNISSARSEYDVAVSTAKLAGNKDLATQISTEEAALK